MSEKVDILSLTIEELTNILVNELKLPKYKSVQIMKWLILGKKFEDMTNISKSDVITLNNYFDIKLPIINEKYVSKIDDTVKYLFELSDGEIIESVVLKYQYGYSICISTEVGCPMGCKFCASTLGGKIRNLLPSEILGQIVIAQKDLEIKISKIVLMGIGEPFDNYINTVKFLKIVTSEYSLNIGCRNISISTCGIVDKIKTFKEERLPVTLSISLHAPNNKIRNMIMPVNNKWCIEELLSECYDYYLKTKRRISFEYILISHVNDSIDNAKELASVLKKYMKNSTFHVNLIPMNSVKESGLKRPEESDVRLFQKTLSDLKINATVRRRLGEDINASCGQLRRNKINNRG